MTAATERLQRIWESPLGLSFELASVDHKKIGERYIATAFGFFVLGGVLAVIMRLQLALPREGLVSAERYDQLFTMHGTTMIFFFATPILSGFGNYFIPLMIGARDMAFPRLNALGYWVFLFSGLFMYSSFIIGAAPNGGWFAYVPLTGPAFSPHVNVDFWAAGLIFLSISTTAGAINFLVTIFKLRTPGMSVNRIPLFVWGVTATSFAIVFALPPLTAGNLLLLSDRNLGTHFFNPAAGGDPLLWQHLFWFFGHPDVYIIFLPAVGIVSTIIPVFCRRPIAAYTLMVLATMSIGIIGFGVWVHHMFAVGLPHLSLAFFSAASMMIAIPSAVQIFAWISTIWDGTPVWRTPFLFILGFIVIFVMGGITGVMFAVVPFDLQATDTYFVVAHFHYVLFGGAVFPIFGALYYWLPKITGRMLDDRLGILCFALMFIGFHMTFFPQHIVGLAGMPRRIYTYDDGLGWTAYNLISTIGSLILSAAVLVFVIDFLRSLRHGAPAGENPWGGNTLEWSTSSPPPEYNFAEIPVVRSRDPLWDQQSLSGYDEENEGDDRVTLSTSIHDARPLAAMIMPAESMLPIIVAFGLAIVAIGVLPSLGLVRIVLFAVGAFIVVSALIDWFWPDNPAAPGDTSEGVNAVGWWGMAFIIVTEGVLFSSLLSGYLYIRSGAEQWPLDGIKKPELLVPAIGTALLLGSSIPMLLAELGIKRGSQSALRLGLLGAFVMGAGFLALQGFEYARSEFSLTTNVYGSLFFVITGLHGLHVFAGLGLNGFIQARAWKGHFTRERHLAVENVAIYWHFVDVVWIFILSVVYLSPHLLPS
ncbi:MAG TPA: cytochrome c oxidase subunit I [Dehalococcoidia bacterium]|nr:cytochrome c oxidase subunit I [Dehalococcoidia bacterium]